MKKILLSAAFVIAALTGANAQQVTWTQDQLTATENGVTLEDSNGYFIFPGGLLEGTLTAVEITATKVSGTTPAGELSIYVLPTGDFAPGGLAYVGGSSNAAIGAAQWYTWPNNDNTTISGIVTLDTPITFTATTTVVLGNLYLQETEATWDNVVVTLYGVSEFSGDYCLAYAAGPWTDFSNSGGAPTTEGTTNEITAFEVWASEAYTIDGFVQGNEYTFSICNGSGTGSWIPDFTVLAPNGDVVAYGVDADSTCSITWTATENGAYIIVINEANNCGVANSIDNGYPAITNNGVASVNNQLAGSFSVYPNPAKDVLNISNSIGAEITAVTVSDINGRTVKQFGSVSQINISDLNAGVYFVNISSNEGSLTKKVVKQ